MSKFLADSCYRMTNEAGDVVLCFTVKRDKKAALMACEEAKAIDGEIEIEVRQHKSKRSAEQNKMLWALLGKLAEAQSGYDRTSTVWDCYCDMLIEANADYEFLYGTDAAESYLRDRFRAVRNVGKTEVGGEKINVYQVFKGSSKFNTKQMTKLIETVLDRLADFGIYDSEIELARSQYKR